MIPFIKKQKLPSPRHSWSLVLNPIKSELAKSRMIERMVEAFPLSLEEAGDLVENTPIILLEGLEQSAGEHIRTHFGETGATLLLTDDYAFKKKCFRAVWPTPPDFKFLNGNNEILLPQTEADTDGTVPQEELTVQNSNFSEICSEETANIQAVEINQNESAPTHLIERAGWPGKKNSEAEGDAERAVRDQKIHQIERERQTLQNIIINLQKENDSLNHETVNQKQKFNDELTQLRNSVEKLAEENKRHTIEKSVLTESESKWMAENKKSIDRCDSLEKQLQARTGELEQKSADLRLSRQNIDELHAKIHQSTEELSKKTSESKRLENELRENQKEIETLKTLIERDKHLLKEADDSLLRERAESQSAAAKFEAIFQKQRSDIDLWKRKFDECASDLRDLRQKMSQWDEERRVDLEHWSQKVRELQSQLETAHKRIRDFTSIAEQQDLIEKRSRSAAALVEKEAQLRELMVRYQALESEVRDRSDHMSSLVAEREQIEKEVAKERQTQKYILEQLKLRDKNHKTSDRLHFKRPEDAAVTQSEQPR